jgi:hypothetical protein
MTWSTLNYLLDQHADVAGHLASQDITEEIL